jgi:predicted pyridoxine 5'-phosphate oxidase superfamily flavin-nucleotide-binding protein
MGERIQEEIMGILTEEMKRVVTEIQLCYAATVTPDGKPNLSPKGSITVLSDDELGFADRAYPGTIENLQHNSAIELNVVDPFIRRGFRFKGAAQVMKEPGSSRADRRGSWGRTIRSSKSSKFASRQLRKCFRRSTP